MITGFDSVVVARTPAGADVRAMLDRVHATWPGMLVALEGPFRPWAQVSPELQAESGELYVARDPAMDRHWDEAGYALMDEGSPFSRHLRDLLRQELID